MGQEHTDQRPGPDGFIRRRGVLGGRFTLLEAGNSAIMTGDKPAKLGWNARVWRFRRDVFGAVWIGLELDRCKMCKGDPLHL